MSPGRAPVLSGTPSFPRVSGDEPNLPPFYAVGYMFSPRERG